MVYFFSVFEEDNMFEVIVKNEIIMDLIFFWKMNIFNVEDFILVWWLICKLI